MFRIDGPGATNDNKFTEGDPANGTRATVVTDEWLNSIQEELANAIEGEGEELSKLDSSQLLTVFRSRVIGVESRTKMKQYDVPEGVQFRLNDGGRSGTFFVKTGTPPISDPFEGVYIVLNNGNYAVRQRGQAVTIGARLEPEWFGLIKDDETIAVAEANHSVFRECIRFSVQHYVDTGAGPADHCPTKIDLPSGKIFVKGNSPMCLNRTEMEALGGNRFLRGLSWAGKGRKSTRVILMNDGASTWLYDTRDPNYPGDTGVQDYTQFSQIGFQSYDHYKSGRKYPVADAEKINGFYLETYGWEKRFNYECVSFEGFDVLYRYEGFGNGDNNTWIAVEMRGIVDTVFYCNNNQSVANRMFGVDVSTYGDVFYVGPNGGGDFLWAGGSVIQYPIHGIDNNPDNTASAASPRAFYHLNLETLASGPTSGIPTAKYVFQKLRFENYDDHNRLVISERDDEVAYGTAEVVFDECTHDIDRFLPDDGSPSEPPTTDRDIVVIKKQQTNIYFKRNFFRKRQYFKAFDLTPSAQSTSSLIFEMPTLTDYEETDLFYDRFEGVNADSSLCLWSVDVRNPQLRRPFFSASTKRRVAQEFSIRNSMVSTPSVETLRAHLKEKDVEWPNGLSSENRLYLPPGAMLTSVLVKKDAVADQGGVTNYRLRIYQDDAATVIWQTADFKEEDALYATYELTNPYIVPEPPNNHIRLAGLNGSAGVDKGNGGAVIISYVTP